MGTSRPPRTEVELLGMLHDASATSPTSASCPGRRLVNLYEFLGDCGYGSLRPSCGRPCGRADADSDSRSALDGRYPLAVQAWTCSPRLRCGAGNLALKYGYRGVYVAGGIAPQMSSG